MIIYYIIIRNWFASLETLEKLNLDSDTAWSFFNIEKCLCVQKQADDEHRSTRHSKSSSRKHIEQNEGIRNKDTGDEGAVGQPRRFVFEKRGHAGMAKKRFARGQ